ncbi:HNH endonuclease [Blastococcus sp. TML/M2B]|uniref:HNH endonuclease signature motif containing protein n=1 Tax=Blastococcus sp. TML/M2B TaxID=2798727 RepID=UPI00190C8204|nr:HNH endonuclease signature motif containing protein [Blastococcus sp. TML/M2B]MBN1092622.1 HNH endonuclease [Blastococcus sp. TML/M2B]
MGTLAGTSVVEGVLIDWVGARPEAHLDLPAEWLTDEQVAGELGRIERDRARQTAREAQLILRLAELRPDTDAGGEVAGFAVTAAQLRELLARVEAPDDTAGYEPRAGQRRFVATRDRRCRMPNCGQRVGWADLDHVVAHADGGATSCANLCCACRSHHRLKTFARGWRFRMDPDGTLHVTSPSGITRTTRPPGLRPPEPPPSPPDPADDPPPF